MSAHGISLAYDAEEDLEDTGDINNLDNRSYGSGEYESPTVSASQYTEGRDRSRRNSESSAWEIDLEARTKSRQPRSRSIDLAASEGQNGDASALLHNHGNTSSDGSDWQRQRLSSIQPAFRTQNTLGAAKKEEPPLPNNVSSEIAPHTQEDNDSTQPAFQVVPSKSKSWWSQASRKRLGATPGVGTGRGDIPPFEPPQTVIEPDASASFKNSTRRATRRFLHQWLAQAIQSRDDNTNLTLLAQSRDKIILTRQALETWHLRLRQHREEAARARFYARYDLRATKAHELYLLTKVLTHWAEITVEQIECTSVARRHILRVRCFNAWQDITAVNELKARKLILRKHFAKWRSQQVTISIRTNRTVATYAEDLIRRAFREWLRKRRELWYIVTTKDREASQAIQLWLELHRKSKSTAAMAINYSHHRLLKGVLLLWLQKAKQFLQQQESAQSLHRDRLYQIYLQRWQQETHLISAGRQFRYHCEGGVVSTVFKMWVLRAQQERKATIIDQLKIKREAWNAFDDRRRCQGMQARIGQRVVFRALQSWVMARRLLGFRARHDQLLKADSMYRLVECWSTRDDDSAQSERRASQYYASRLRNRVFISWRTCLSDYLEDERMALGFTSSIYTAKALAKWVTEKHRLELLDRCAKDANFYIIATHTLGRWKTSTESLRRQKRRLAYAQMRRQIKLSVASKMLNKWRLRAATVLQSKDQAFERLRNRDASSCANVLQRWRAKAENFTELGEATISRFRSQSLRAYLILWDRRATMEAKARCHVQGKYFTRLLRCIKNHDNLEQQAHIRAEEHYTNACSQCFRRWNARALQNGGKDGSATRLRDKFARKRSIKILIFWRRSLLRKQQPQNTAPEHSLVPIARVTPAQFSRTSRNEDWTDFNLDWEGDLDDAVSSTPKPGYLNTPSRRVDRLKVAAESSTTPRYSPPSTPLPRGTNRYPSSSFARSSTSASRGGGLFRSVLGKRRTINDIPEESPQTPQRSNFGSRAD